MQLILNAGATRLFLASVVVVHHTTRLGFGTWAVFVFFILSGYWISRMWEQKYLKFDRPFRTFITSRYLRLMPTLMLSIGLLLLAKSIMLSETDFSELGKTIDVQWLLRTLAIIGSYSQTTFLGPKWSIDIEIQFYLLAATVFILFPGPYSSKVLVSALVLTVLLFLVSINFYDYPAKVLVPYLGLFVLGAVIHKAEFKSSKILAILSLCTFVILCALVVAHPTYRYIIIGGYNAHEDIHAFNEMFSYVGALIVAPYIAYSLSIKSSKLDLHLGNLAYPIYLFHMIPVAIYRFYFGSLPAFERVPFLLVTYLAIALGSIAIYFWFDRPIDSYRQKLIGKPPTKIPKSVTGKV